MRTLHQCLLDSSLVRLRAIARFWDVELTAKRQRDVADQLAQAMATPKAIAGIWEALPDDQRQALASLIAAGGRIPLRIFVRRWGEIRTMGPGRMEREQPWQEPVSTAEGLWYTGLIFSAFEQGPEETYEVVLIPAELRSHLPASAAPPPVISIEPSPAPNTVRSAADALVDDACTLLAYLQNERLRLNPGDAWPDRHQTRLLRRLRDPTLARLAFLHHLVRQLGWLRVTDAGYLRPDPGPVTAWLQAPTTQQRNTLAQAWRDDSTWNDLFHVPTLSPEDTGAWRNDPLLARGAVLRHLRTCVGGNWYGVENLVGAIKQADPDFQRPGGDYTSWYICDAVTGVYLSGFESWDAVEGALIRYLITGPLAWLGLLDLGTSPSPVPPPSAQLPASYPLPSASLRLTPTGSAFLGLAEPPPEPKPAPLALRPDFTVLAPPPRRYERFQLARVADWVSSPSIRETGRTDDDPFVHRLTPASLERARQQGIPVARVLEFLGQSTDAPVPRFAEAALTRWEARGAEARLERVVLLRLSSEGLMEQIASSPLTGHLIGERVGPATALVRKRDWPRLIAALGKLGLLADVAQLEEDGDT
jgi:hypothetical protein